MTTLPKRGSRGAAVRDLQLLLNRVPEGSTIKVDGGFGAATEAAVKGGADESNPALRIVIFVLRQEANCLCVHAGVELS